MAAITWPAELPQALPVDVDQVPPDTRVRWDPEAGPSRIRRVGTAASTFLRVPPLRMSESQVALFEEFYRDALDHGVEGFDWLNPWPGAGLVRLYIVSYGPVRWTSGPLIVQPDELVTGSSQPQRLARMPLELEWRPWEPFELAVASATLTLAARVTLGGGFDLAASGIQAGDFFHFAADGKGKATEILTVTLPSTLDLVGAYPVGPVGRAGAGQLVKVARG